MISMNIVTVSQGAGVWVPDPEAVWVSAQLLQDYRPGDQHIRIQLTDDRVWHLHILIWNHEPLRTNLLH